MLLGGHLRSRAEAIDEYFGIGRTLQCRWDLVITAEGCLDFQSPQGKMTTEVARRARLHGAQVVALAGTLGAGAEGCYDAGLDAFTSIMKGPTSLEDAIAKTAELVQDGAERLMRTIAAGLVLGRGSGMHSLPEAPQSLPKSSVRSDIGKTTSVDTNEVSGTKFIRNEVAGKKVVRLSWMRWSLRKADRQDARV
ncbi:glycerate kinase [Sporormia fimetaria CBS 119925]|uniref:Glycerate kinase n=1 Tax=Sporormia fimetaria CBS 119925 TaxID=1340428 RepID=A0A6A6UVQ4_9PLEO|nr:glycerate kinase [Sporormia fimetaria CBS 119925]